MYQADSYNGQIVLSREKAERLRQWEYILQHCEEGSIVKGRVLRKVKGGLMVDIGMEPLGIQLRKNLKGITTNGVNSKSSQYADDTSMYVKDYKDLEKAKQTLLQM